MKDFYVEFEPKAAARKAGACCMSYQVRALTAAEAVRIATQLLKSCGEHVHNYNRPAALEGHHG